MNNRPKEYSINTELLQAVIDYLSTRPYKEVAHLIGSILVVTQNQQRTIPQTEVVE
jgi:hypothetical protein